jgi:hypothetical protein
VCNQSAKLIRHKENNERNLINKMKAQLSGSLRLPLLDHHHVLFFVCKLALLATCFHAGFLLRLFFDAEDGGDMFIRNFGGRTLH